MNTIQAAGSLGHAVARQKSHPAARYRRGLWWMLAPYLLGAIFLIAIPALLSFALAFTRYDALSPPLPGQGLTWVGIQNFLDLFYEPLLRVALNNSFFFIVLAVPARMLAALGLALFYRKPGRMVRLYRSAIFLPVVIPEIAYILAWNWILNPLFGPLNSLLRSLGLPAPAWLVEYAWAKPALVLMALFTIGESFVVLLAALRTIPSELFDSAQVDGGSSAQILRWVILPLLWPWLALLTLRDVTLSFQSTFAPALLITRGGPYYSTLFMPLLIYEEAFDGLRFGQAAALMLLLFLGSAALIWMLYQAFGARNDDL